MSQFYVPGPARISTWSGSGGTAEYLGFSVDGVVIAVQPRWDDVFSDLAGPAVPEDIQFLGADAVIRMTLSRYNEPVLQRLRAFLNGGTDGAFANYSIGSLLKTEGLATRLLVRATYGPTSQGAKSAYSAQRGVYNFPLTCLVDAVEIPISTRYSLPRITFRAWPDFQSDQGGAILYNDVVTGEPAID